VQLDDAPGYRKPEAGTALPARARGVDLPELLEDALAILRRDATPVSLTATTKLPSATVARMLTDPASVNLMALLTRFISTWIRRRSSPRPRGRSRGTSISSPSFFSAASASVALTTSSTSSRIE
jgi:hypothetical protein